MITAAQQIERLVSLNTHPPFELTLGIGTAGERVAGEVNERTGWFPRVRRVDVGRQEDGQGGHDLVSSAGEPFDAELGGLGGIVSLAVVDDTVFSGLTMRGVLRALPDGVLERAHAFCLRSVAESLPSIEALCPVSVGLAAPGRRDRDVSFINASGLVRKIGIRRAGLTPMAFFERPEWIEAWFPGRGVDVIGLCAELNALLEAAKEGSHVRQVRPS